MSCPPDDGRGEAERDRDGRDEAEHDRDGRDEAEHDRDGRDEAERDQDGRDEAEAGGDSAGRGPWLVTGAFAALLLLSSVVPVPGSAPPVGSGVGALPLDIGLTDPFHLLGYAVLTLLAGRAIGRGRGGLFVAAGAAVAVGFGIELVQAPIPWRSFAWRDAAVNAVGAVIGAGALAAVDAAAAVGLIGASRDRSR